LQALLRRVQHRNTLYDEQLYSFFMKRLSLIRHAKSEWANSQIEDIDRPLNSRGYEDAKAMALRIKKTQGIPDCLFSSTAVRAATTALIFGRVFGLEANQMIFTAKLYESSEASFLKVLRNIPDSYAHVCVFGHNPTITEIANRLSGEKILNIPTCGVVILEVGLTSWKDLSTAKLLLFDFPKNPQEN
jgi:phosphohistidine phosphatase